MIGIFYAVVTVLGAVLPSRSWPWWSTPSSVCTGLKDPQPKTRAATLTLIGCVLAMIGGVVLGNLKLLF